MTPIMVMVPLLIAILALILDCVRMARGGKPVGKTPSC